MSNASEKPVKFWDDVAFLRAHTDIVVLDDQRGKAHIAVAPGWQGRVMTSSAQSGADLSFGWINRDLIASGRLLTHFNPLGGEDRLWLGPEGGQFSIYFAPGAPFDLEHWFVPKALDTQPFQTIDRSKNHIVLQSSFELVNRSGTHFNVRLTRTVEILEPQIVWKSLALPAASRLSLVGYESRNTLTNAGTVAWSRNSGLLSLWVLGMFNPSDSATIVVPILEGSELQLGKAVTSDYFGAIPPSRLRVEKNAVFLRADGQFRSKIGVNPRRSLGKLGSYDAQHHVLTIVQFDRPAGGSDYVNSLWKIQTDPFAGDAANAYNDGPPAPGQPPMGPFFELESSSPAAALAPGASLSHTHRTIHLTGSPNQLDRISRAVLGVPLADIR